MKKSFKKLVFFTRFDTKHWIAHYFLIRFDTFWHVFDTFLTLFRHFLQRFDTRLLFDTFWHVLTLSKSIVFSYISVVFWHFLTRLDTFWPCWSGFVRSWEPFRGVREPFEGIWSVKKSICWHVLTRDITRKRWFRFLTRGRAQTFFDTRIFLTRFDTNFNTYEARAQMSKNSVKKYQKIRFFTRFDTFWHKWEHLWSQSRVFVFWHVLARGECQ